MNIHIGKITVPLADYAVGANAILGIRDSGKTVTAKGIAEQLIDNDIPIFVFDAVGKWRWMKSPGQHSRGKSYKVVVAGGRQPDLPLTPHSVPEIIRSALKERIPLIIDLYDPKLSKADWRRIVQQAIRIIHYENEGGACHVFLEEAAEYCPQKVMDNETYAEVEKLVRMGGNASVGITLINQRSQEVNKAVLDNCSTALVLGCQVGQNAIDAVGRWIERLDRNTAKEVIESLPKLTAGKSWVWTRTSLDHPTCEQMPMCRSFHPDRRTPEVVLKALKSSDTGEFIERMTKAIPKVIEDAKANDPRELKAKIQQLEREKLQLTSAKPAPVATKVEYVPMLTDEERRLLKNSVEACDKVLDAMLKNNSKLVDSIQDMRNNLLPIIKKASTPVISIKSHPPHVPLRVIQPPKISPVVYRKDIQESNGETRLGRGEREVMIAIAQSPDGIDDANISVLTGYKKTSRTTFKQRLASAGFIEKQGDKFLATQEGIDWLGSDYRPLPTGDALREHWMGRLTGGELELFKVYVANYPVEVDIQQVMLVTGYQKTSVTTFRQRLAARNLLDGNKASDNLFT